MSAHQTLAKNTLFLTAASIGQKVIALVYFFLISGYLGTEGTGGYFLALAMVTTIGVIDDIGLTSVLIRGVASKPSEAATWLRNVLGYKVFTIPFTILLAFVVPALAGFDAEAAYLVRIAIAIMIADTLSLTCYGVLRGMQSLKYESLGIFVGQLVTSVIGIGLVVTGTATLPLLIVALIVGSVWNLVFSAVQVARCIGWGAFVPAYTMGNAPLKMAFAFFLSAVFVKVYSYMDSFILNATLGESAVGVYSIAYKMTYAFQFLPLALVGALYPSLSAAAGDPERLKKIFFAAEWYVALLAAPIVFGIWSLAPELVGLLKPEFAEAAGPLSILIFVLIFIFLDFPIGSLLNATHRQATKTVIMGATMVINICANIYLIPRFNVEGASIAALISFVFMFVAGWGSVAAAAKLSFAELVQKVGGFFLAGAVMGVVVIAAKAYIPWVSAIPIGAAVYVVLIFAMKTVTVDHLRQMRSIVRPEKPYATNTSADN